MLVYQNYVVYLNMCVSINLVADKIQKLLKEELAGNFSIIRVYSPSLERCEHPIPRDIPEIKMAKENGYDIKKHSPCSSIALHNLIRMDTNSRSQWLLEKDNEFSRKKYNPNAFDDAEMTEYERIIRQACEEELKKCDAVFCTIMCSATRRITSSMNIKQIIIDESGMCTEPDTFVPIASCQDVENVVLIGDHKQLEPIVHCPEAKMSGMKRSLFQRYFESNPSSTNMLNTLTTQYRMVLLHLGCIILFYESL